ncbi:hypothetical protein CEXT_235701 [Caerostris extrusa]|uniref:Uncharacterized protein n=1 Tax=Caerostris extrusa TaxID=172846 RepID=A0AAV4N4T0_CAEEX|nr:hypothetical protein CEXT_235701 [Caerostris extrusa]
MQFQSGLQDHLSWPPVVEINEAPSNADIYEINNRIHYQRQSSTKTKSQMSQNRPEAVANPLSTSGAVLRTGGC